MSSNKLKNFRAIYGKYPSNKGCGPSECERNLNFLSSGFILEL